MGLAAREIERRGTPTAVLSWMPALTAAAGAPRVVGIEYPGAMTFGEPGAADEQRDVLRAALKAAASIEAPGQRIDLDFRWPPQRRNPKPRALPPIVAALIKRPWLLSRLLDGRLPER